jgi:hypothetical protein
MPDSANHENNSQAREKKKISLEEAMRQKLEKQKKEKPKGKSTINSSVPKKMKNQYMKKTNIRQRRTGV